MEYLDLYIILILMFFFFEVSHKSEIVFKLIFDGLKIIAQEMPLDSLVKLFTILFW